MNESIRVLHFKAVRISTQYRKREADLLSVLQEIDSKRAYLHFGATSLYDYCVNVLKLSEGISHSLMSVSRKSREVPAMKAAILNGELSISKAHKIVSVIDKNNQDEWLKIASTQTSREIEKAVVTVNPRAATKERVRYITEDRVELNVGLSEAVLKNLERVMDLESQRRSKPASREDGIAAALESYLDANDPLRKAKRLQSKVLRKAESSEGRGHPKTATNGNSDGISSTSNVELKNGELPSITVTNRDAKLFPGPVDGAKKPSVRKALSTALIRAIDLRDEAQCTHFDDKGKRCANRRWLDYHHIIPVAHGGLDKLENITTLCSSHHRLVHLPEHSEIQLRQKVELQCETQCETQSRFNFRFCDEILLPT
jgi:hypothetical protein